jgi:hypothetical protein
MRPTTTAAYPPSWPKETKKLLKKENASGRERKWNVRQSKSAKHESYLCVVYRCLFLLFRRHFHNSPSLLLSEKSPEGMTGRDSRLRPNLWTGKRANNSGRHRCIMQILQYIYIYQMILNYFGVSVADPDPGPRILDSVPFWPLDPGSWILDLGWVKSQDLDPGFGIQGPGSGMKNQDHIS